MALTAKDFMNPNPTAHNQQKYALVGCILKVRIPSVKEKWEVVFHLERALTAAECINEDTDNIKQIKARLVAQIKSIHDTLASQKSRVTKKPTRENRRDRY